MESTELFGLLLALKLSMFLLSNSSLKQYVMKSKS